MFSDFRFALRTLVRTPGFTAIALLTLALGIGVNTSMFTVINTLLFPQLPFPNSSELVRVFRTSPQSQQWPHAVGNYLDLQRQNHTFAAMAAYVNSNSNYSAPGQPAERLRSMTVTGDFFPLLGINPALGRAFNAEEMRPGGPAVVILSHEFWTTRFAADPHAIGQTMRIDGGIATIIGVMPENFTPRLLWGPVQLWRPFVFTAKNEQNRENNYISIVGRLAPGATRAQAEAELKGITARLAEQFPLTSAGSSVRLVPLAQSGANITVRQVSWCVLGLAGFVLLIACANLANLQIGRSAGRMREHAIRLALGASRWRVMRTLFAESMLLGLVGGGLGLLLAVWSNEFLGRQLVLGPQAGFELSLDLRVLAFAAGAAVFAVFASGLLPAWLAARANTNDALKAGSRGIVAGNSHHRLRHALIVGEVALALILLTGAGIFLRGLQRLNERDPGWQPENLTFAIVNLPLSKYPDHERRDRFFQKLEVALAASPLIERASISSAIPTTFYGSGTNYVAEGRPLPKPGTEPLANIVYVNSNFTNTLGIRLVRGRFISPDDLLNKPEVIVINETMARAFFPGEDPIGKRIGDPDPLNPSWLQVVGVVADVSFPGEVGAPDTYFQAYRPIHQASFNFSMIAVHGRGPADALAAELRRIVASVDPDQPVSNITTAQTDIGRALANMKLISRLLAGFASLGLVLAAIGIYGVLSNFVVQRTPEIGVRIALGAQLRDVLLLILRHGLQLALVGTALGFVGAFILAKLLTRLLPALGAPDPVTLGGVTALLLLVALLACWLPARRAARVDPIQALRAE